MASATPSSSFVLSTTYFAALLASFPAFPSGHARSRGSKHPDASFSRPSPTATTRNAPPRDAPTASPRPAPHRSPSATPPTCSAPPASPPRDRPRSSPTPAASRPTAAADSRHEQQPHPARRRVAAKRRPRRANQSLHVLPRRGHRLVVFPREFVQQRMRREGGALVPAKRRERRRVRGERPPPESRTPRRRGPTRRPRSISALYSASPPRPYTSRPCKNTPGDWRETIPSGPSNPAVAAARIAAGLAFPVATKINTPAARVAPRIRVRGSWRDDALAVQERPVQIEHETVRLGGPSESAEKTRVDGAGVRLSLSRSDPFASRDLALLRRVLAPRRHQPSGSARESSSRQQTQQFVLARRHAFGVFVTRLVVEAREV